MTDADYLDWSQFHGALFGFSGAQCTEMFAAWRKVFELCQYQAEELREASTWLGANSPPAFPSQHLAGLNARIREQRAVRYRREGERFVDRGTCTLCRSCGFVTVPHLAGIDCGQWVAIRAARAGATWYTQAVLCSCALGRWKAERFPDREKRPMGLEVYEQRNPDWREQQDRRRLAQLATIEAEDGPLAESFDDLRRKAGKEVKNGRA